MLNSTVRNLLIYIALLFYLSGCAEGGDGPDNYGTGNGTGKPEKNNAVITEVVAGVAIEIGDEWRYRKGTSALPSDWNSVGFDDTTWLAGNTGIGYGDGDDATILSDMQGNYATVYTRKVLNYDGSVGINSLELEIDYDDGFVAYINGQEVARANMPAGQPSFDTLASVGGHEAGVATRINLDGFINLIGIGDNVLAIEIHNDALTSSDLSFLPRLLVNMGSSPPATVSLSANPTSVVSNGSTTLSWTSTNADTCTASGNWSGGRSTSGSVVINSLTVDQIYTLTCTGAGGTASDSASVTVVTPSAPIVNISASPLNVAFGGSTTLSWTGSNVDTCTASGNWSGGRSTSGSVVINSLTADQIYTLTCTGAGGTASDSASVTVVTPSAPIVNISASPLNVAFGGSTTLSWTGSNVDTCTASGNWSGGRSTSGSANRNNLIADRTYTLTCTGAGGTASDSVNVTVTPPLPTLSFTANPGTVTQNGSTTLNWASTNADTCVASGNWSGTKGVSGSQTIVSITSNRQFTLACSGAGGVVTNTVTVTYNAGNTAPVANAGTDQNVVTGAQVNLNGSGSTDVDGDPLTYAWTLVSKPAGSAATLSAPVSALPSFTADVDGVYQISLVVNDGTVSSAADQVAVVSSSSSYDCSSNDVHCVDDTAGINQEYTTIQTAVNISQPGDVVLVFDGNYDGFRVSSSGTNAQRLKIVAQSNNANITGSEPFGQNAIRIENSSYITIEGFRIDGSGFPAGTNYDYACIAARGANTSSPMQSLFFIKNYLTDCAPAGMYLSNVQDLQISGNVVKYTNYVGGNSGMGVYLANAGVKNALIVENIISGNDDVAIHFNGDVGVGGDGIQSGHVIKRNEFDSNGSNGFSMDGVQDVLIENNIFSNNGKHGIRGYRIDGAGGPKDWVIVNNTFYNNESPAKTSEDAGGHIIFNNIVANNINNSFLMNAGDFSSSNNLFTTNQNSIFVNAATNDLRLISGSSPVNSGIASFIGNSAPAEDLSAASRTALPDIGAFELGSNYPSWYQ